MSAASTQSDPRAASDAAIALVRCVATHMDVELQLGNVDAHENHVVSPILQIRDRRGPSRAIVRIRKRHGRGVLLPRGLEKPKDDRAPGRAPHQPSMEAPGMSAQVEVITGRRSVLSYLLSPIARAVDEAGRER